MGSINAPFVVFGYGSLIFKPPPHVQSQTSGFLKGYVRRFAQESHDHRGTPENPGRVVTLIHKEDWDRFSQSDAFPDEDIVWGIAYTIDPEYEAEVRDYLGETGHPIIRGNIMDQDGYTMETLHVYTIENGIEKIAIQDCYVGRPDNPSFIGSEPLEDLAQRIWVSEYLYRLAESVRQLAPASYDSHLFALEGRLRELDSTASVDH
ncbi:ChaC-like protein [Suillus subaureus]|uniref:glutathione-specific gamma-glutamylcyclotransferase n=1 Tax=Suillus subaureus TaxID=48587 RepID=A0A9P7E8L4_9AGAM|nr:ChaC-like protein [Suillus subaureus]KAG1814360.1 ChaC-like protein [Suillus subaureus]